MSDQEFFLIALWGSILAIAAYRKRDAIRTAALQALGWGVVLGLPAILLYGFIRFVKWAWTDS